MGLIANPVAIVIVNAIIGVVIKWTVVVVEWRIVVIQGGVIVVLRTIVVIQWRVLPAGDLGKAATREEQDDSPQYFLIHFLPTFHGRRLRCLARCIN